jgi:peptidyl-prolyl cis-trans isomerase-like protein 2
MYITATEHKYLYGGKHDKAEAGYQQLPYDHCMLSFTPFETPACTPEGHIFDILNILPYLKAHKKHPLTGEKLALKDLIHLHFHKNTQGKYFCPVTYKEFNNNSHICTIKTSGNVYSYSAVQELNVKAKNWTDLLTGEAFKRSDILVLQDPTNIEARSTSNFTHMHEHWLATAGKDRAKAEDASNIRVNPATSRIFDEIAENRKRREDEEAERLRNQPVKKRVKTGDTSHALANSFTSTAVDVATRTEYRDATDEEVMDMRHAALKKFCKEQKPPLKGYVRLCTTAGDINLEVHSDITPRCAENFLGLCRKDYYNGVQFHRVIRNFMAQAGDPSGTGRGGESLWGESFKDEFTSQVVHDKRGVLSMANAGRNTNGSQFFITFKSCSQLNNKHSVFGRVVGGLDVLAKIESGECDDEDRPAVDVTILRTVIFTDPVALFEAAEAEAEKTAGEPEKEKFETEVVQVGDDWVNRPKTLKNWSNPQPLLAGAGSTGVGKYMQKAGAVKVRHHRRRVQFGRWGSTALGRGGGYCCVAVCY